MIGFLEGKLRHKAPDAIILDVHGVGYIVHVSLTTFYDLPDPGQTTSLHIHTYVREDLLQLYGFRTVAEKESFLQLITVNGVGPRLATTILSSITSDQLRQIIMQQDAKRLRNVPGVGKKIAERIMLELRDKLKLQADKESEGMAIPLAVESNAYSDAFSALSNLGYRPPEAERALRKALQTLGQDAPIEKLLKEALRVLA